MRPLPPHPDKSAWADAHCHLQTEAFAPDLPRLLERAAVFGIRRFVVSATRPDDWDAVAALARRHAGVCPQFGVHPWHAAEATKAWETRLKEMLLRFPEAGIGEIGLDRKLTYTPIETQREVFRAQLRVAAALNRPCTIHLIGAWAELHEDLEAHSPPRFLLHAFNGSPEQVKAFAKRPCWFSFGGAVIRQSNSDKLRDAVRAVPDDRLLLETDAPNQHPEDRGARQEPAGLIRVAEAVARLRGLPVDRLRQQTARNLQAWLGTP